MLIVLQQDKLIRLDQSPFRSIGRCDICFIIFDDLIFQAIVVDF